jgi:DNA-binding XRE family transcriptional regulator
MPKMRGTGICGGEVMAIFCDSCGKIVRGNIKGDEKEWRIYCWRCTDKRVQKVEQLEKMAGIDIHNQESYLRSISISQDKGKKDDLLEKLKLLRKSHKWPQVTMAAKLNLSRSYYAEMERGRKPLTDSVLRILNDLEAGAK